MQEEAMHELTKAPARKHTGRLLRIMRLTDMQFTRHGYSRHAARRDIFP